MHPLKKRFTQLLVVILLLCSIPFPVHAAGSSDGLDKLVLYQDSKQMLHNGKAVSATQPLTAIKGVTYVAARSLMNEIYGKIVYDSKNKQYILTKGDTELRFKVDQSNYFLNGNSEIQGTGAPYLLKGSLMIPLRTVAVNFGLNIVSISKEKRVELTWASKPIAKFTVSNVNPYAEQTEVSYTDQSYHPAGLAIIDERWENNLTIFDQAGSYTVSHWVQDANGNWSDAYTVTITVKPPNQPPVAFFTTDKDSYKMGELITYTDESTDDENAITSRVWTNNERGFFVPGPQLIKLYVTDVNGAIDEFYKTITIEDETLHTKAEFDLLYTELGDKFPINGSSVLSFPTVDYTIIDGDQTLIRANSPETMLEEGIYYEDTVSGNVRFMLHNLNGRTTPVKIYILLTNENAEDATVRMGAQGMAGPNPFVSTVSKAVTGRFLESLLNPAYSDVFIPAGESRLIFQDYSAKAVKPGNVYSMFGDVQMSANLKFQVIVVDEKRDVMAMLPYLKVLPSNDRHIRGTFENADRDIIVEQPIGHEKVRMILADNIVDTRLSGIDKTTYTPVLNAGNYGVLYKITLVNVQPNTAIVVNPRGGHYAGAFTINGKVVYTNNTLSNANEVGMLYKTGNSGESVTITFTPASGSNLPINLLFLPMPLSN